MRGAPASRVAKTPGCPSVGTRATVWKPASRASRIMSSQPSAIPRFSAAMDGCRTHSCRPQHALRVALHDLGLHVGQGVRAPSGAGKSHRGRGGHGRAQEIATGSVCHARKSTTSGTASGQGSGAVPVTKASTNSRAMGDTITFPAARSNGVLSRSPLARITKVRSRSGTLTISDEFAVQLP